MALNFKKMEEELDRALAKETKESLLAWLDKKRGEVSEFGVEQQVNAILPEEFLETWTTDTGEKLELTPIQSLKLLMIAKPNEITYEGKEWDEYFSRIEKWLNNLIKRVSERQNSL